MQIRRSRFTGLFLCLALLVALLPLGSAAPQQPSPAQAERDRLVQKVREVNRWGPEARIVNDVAGEVDKLIAEGIDAEIQVGWGLTNDGNAYRLNWKKKAFSFDALSEADAAKAGFAEMSMRVVRLSSGKEKPAVAKATKEETFAKGLPYFISEVPGQAPPILLPEKSVTIRVRVARGQTPVSGAAMEVRFQFSSGNKRLFSYPEFPAAGAEKEIPVEIGWDKDLAGMEELHCVITAISPPQVTGGQVSTNTLSNLLLVTVKVGSK